MKRKISILLAMVMLFGFTPAILILNFLAPNIAYAVFYYDVNEDDDCYEAVTNLSERDILFGYEDFTFHPENNVTRAETATIIIRTLGKEDEAAKWYYHDSSSFSDMDVSHWANAYVNLCWDLYIIDGMGDGTFAPDNEITYSQMAKILVCMAGLEQKAMEHGGWPDGYEYVANVTGYMDGIKEKIYEYSIPATRGDIAIMFNNFLNIVGTQDSENTAIKPSVSTPKPLKEATPEPTKESTPKPIEEPTPTPTTISENKMSLTYNEAVKIVKKYIQQELGDESSDVAYEDNQTPVTINDELAYEFILYSKKIQADGQDGWVGTIYVHEDGTVTD